MSPSHSDLSRRKAAIRAVVQLYRLTLSDEAFGLLVRELDAIDSDTLEAACRKLLNRDEHIGNPIAAIKREAGEVRQSVRRPVGDDEGMPNPDQRTRPEDAKKFMREIRERMGW
jgi:hypothetical protein